MRRGQTIFAVISLSILAYAVWSVRSLLALLVVDGAADAITRAEIPPPDAKDLFNSRPQLIPKILHQTYVNESIPARWQEAQKSCVDLHKDYEYKLWTDKSARDFIAAEYSWFLETFDAYPYPIQRADAIRYFILYHFGGVYLDLDDGCQRRLDPLLIYPAWLRRTLPTGISNDAMGSVPKHPFFLKVMNSLSKYNRSWFLSYITVMGTTGPLFLSVLWVHYMREVAEEQNRVRVLFPEEYGKHSWSFFRWYPGSSWHRDDVHIINWLAQHWILITVSGFFIIISLFFTVYWLFGRSKRSPPSKRQSTRRRARFWRRGKALLAYLRVPGFKDSSNRGDYEVLLTPYDEDRLQA